jgi:ferritin-like metal-binding protein YciE
MKLVSEKIPDLQALYVKQLRLLLSAEELISSKSLFLLETAMDDELRDVLNKHWQDSERQAARLREIISRVSKESEPIKCTTVYALFDEAEDLIQDAAHDSVRNISLLAVARRIKHYELSFYETVWQFAVTLRRNDDARLLEKSIREEAETTQQLARIADRLTTSANKAAA